MFHVMRVGVNAFQMKAFMCAIRYPYYDFHEAYFNKWISEFARKDFIEKLDDLKNHHQTVTLLIKILRDVLREYIFILDLTNWLCVI